MGYSKHELSRKFYCTFAVNCTILHTYIIQCQFGCGILKMVGPKMQVFAQESTCSKEIFLKQSCDELWFVKKCRNRTFKVNFLCQKSTELKKIKNMNINSGDHFL
jgi:hypothetical protein